MIFGESFGLSSLQVSKFTEYEISNLDIYVTLFYEAGIMMRDLFPEPEIVCKILGTEQWGAVSWILEWIVKSLEGVDLNHDADKKSSTREELLLALRFRNFRNKC